MSKSKSKSKSKSTPPKPYITFSAHRPPHSTERLGRPSFAYRTPSDGDVWLSRYFHGVTDRHEVSDALLKPGTPRPADGTVYAVFAALNGEYHETPSIEHNSGQITYTAGYEGQYDSRSRLITSKGFGTGGTVRYRRAYRLGEPVTVTTHAGVGHVDEIGGSGIRGESTRYTVRFPDGLVLRNLDASELNPAPSLDVFADLVKESQRKILESQHAAEEEAARPLAVGDRVMFKLSWPETVKPMPGRVKAVHPSSGGARHLYDVALDDGGHAYACTDLVLERIPETVTYRKMHPCTVEPILPERLDTLHAEQRARRVGIMWELLYGAGHGEAGDGVLDQIVDTQKRLAALELTVNGDPTSTPADAEDQGERDRGLVGRLEHALDEVEKLRAELPDLLPMAEVELVSSPIEVTVDGSSFAEAAGPVIAKLAELLEILKGKPEAVVNQFTYPTAAEAAATQPGEDVTEPDTRQSMLIHLIGTGAFTACGLSSAGKAVSWSASHKRVTCDACKIVHQLDVTDTTEKGTSE